MPLRILDTDKVISLDDKYIVWLKYSTGRIQTVSTSDLERYMSKGKYPQDYMALPKYENYFRMYFNLSVAEVLRRDTVFTDFSVSKELRIIQRVLNKPIFDYFIDGNTVSFYVKGIGNNFYYINRSQNTLHIGYFQTSDLKRLTRMRSQFDDYYKFEYAPTTHEDFARMLKSQLEYMDILNGQPKEAIFGKLKNKKAFVFGRPSNRKVHFEESLKNKYGKYFQEIIDGADFILGTEVWGHSIGYHFDVNCIYTFGEEVNYWLNLETSCGNFILRSKQKGILGKEKLGECLEAVLCFGDYVERNVMLNGKVDMDYIVALFSYYTFMPVKRYARYNKYKEIADALKRLQGDDSWNFLNNYSDSFVK